MASIKRQPNGRYQARYRDAKGAEHSQRFDKKKSAQDWLDSVTTATRTGTYVDPRAGRAMVGDLAPLWLQVKSARVKPSTLAEYDGLLRGHVLPRWRDVQVSTIDTVEVEAWVAELTKAGLSASRTRQAYLVLRGILDTAVKSRRLAVNPAQRIDLPRPPQRTRRYLTMAQLERLADAAGDYGLLVRVLGYCGLRWGEATALTVCKADLLRSRLLVDCALSDIGGTITVGTTKSHKSREVPVSRFLRDALAEHIAGGSPDDLVFPAPRGGYLRNGNFRRGYFNRASVEVGLPGLVPHELRHTAASLAIRSGANIKVVQTMMGHASATMTWDLYGHLYDDDLDRMVERLDDARAEFLRTKCGQAADNAVNVVELGRAR